MPRRAGRTRQCGVERYSTPHCCVRPGRSDSEAEGDEERSWERRAGEGRVRAAAAMTPPELESRWLRASR